MANKRNERRKKAKRERECEQARREQALRFEASERKEIARLAREVRPRATAKKAHKVARHEEGRSFDFSLFNRDLYERPLSKGKGN